MMKIWDEATLTKKRDVPVGIVTNGLVLWIDARDGLFNQDGTPIANGSTKHVVDDNVHFLNRADGKLIKIKEQTSTSRRTANIVCENDTFKFSVSDYPSVATTKDFNVGFSLPSSYTTEIVITSEYVLKSSDNIVASVPTVGTLGISSTNTIILRPNNQNSDSANICKIASASLFTGTPIMVTGNAYDAGTKKRIFRNGQIVAQNDGTPDAAQWYAPQFIVKSYISKGLTYIWITSIRFYNRALSAGEVMQNYNAEKALGRVL